MEAKVEEKKPCRANRNLSWKEMMPYTHPRLTKRKRYNAASLVSTPKAKHSYPMVREMKQSCLTLLRAFFL